MVGPRIQFMPSQPTLLFVFFANNNELLHLHAAIVVELVETDPPCACADGKETAVGRKIKICDHAKTCLLVWEVVEHRKRWQMHLLFVMQRQIRET